MRVLFKRAYHGEAGAYRAGSVAEVSDTLGQWLVMQDIATERPEADPEFKVVDEDDEEETIA